MFVKINGERHYLWRAVDHEGEVLESFVTKTRDKKAAIEIPKESNEKAWPSRSASSRTSCAPMAPR